VAARRTGRSAASALGLTAGVYHVGRATGGAPGLHEWPQRLNDLVLFWKPARRMLREDEVSICDNVENAVVTLDQSGFDSQLSRQLGPQTGGARKVVSAHAICNRDVHLWISCRRPAVPTLGIAADGAAWRTGRSAAPHRARWPISLLWHTTLLRLWLLPECPGQAGERAESPSTCLRDPAA